MKDKILLRVSNISKKFGAVQALYKVDLELYENEVLGLVGDNGAGKTTLIKIISGVYPPDAGEIFLQGRRVQIENPQHAKKLGLETVYQDLALADDLSITENVFLGREYLKEGFWGKTMGILHRQKMERETVQIKTRLKIDIGSPRLKVKNLSGGQRQAVAFARSIYWKAKIVIMDEPTAALGVPETEKVRELILELKNQGVSILIISHNLEDIFSVCDRIIVLRRGRRAGDRKTEITNRDEIVRLMITDKENSGR